MSNEVQELLFDLAAQASAGMSRIEADRLASSRRWARPQMHGRDGRVMHADSLAARERHTLELSGRMLDVWNHLRTHGPATDRELRDALFGATADMNMVRPRITDLKRLGRVREIGHRADPVTGVPVRIVEAVEVTP